MINNLKLHCRISENKWNTKDLPRWNKSNKAFMVYFLYFFFIKKKRLNWWKECCILGTSSRACRNLIYCSTQHEGPPVRGPLFDFWAGDGLFFSCKIFSDLIRAVAILFCTKFTDFSDNIDLQEFFRPFGLFGLGLCNGWPRKVSPP